MATVYAGVLSAGSKLVGFINVTPQREVITGSVFKLNYNKYSFDPAPGVTIASALWNPATTLPNGYPSFVCQGAQGQCDLTKDNQDRIYNSVGNAFASVTLTSTAGVSSTAAVEVINVNSGHAPVAIMNLSQVSGPAPLTILGDGLASYDYDGNIVSYAWTWGSSSSSGPQSSYTFTTPGTYTVTLKVTDNAGNPRTLSKIITVTPSFTDLGSDQTPSTSASQLLENACAAEDAAACSALADFYKESSFVYDELRRKSCALNFYFCKF
jgi:PKD repeat protein